VVAEKSFELKMMSTNDAGLERKSFMLRFSCIQWRCIETPNEKHGCLSSPHFLQMKGELFSFESDETHYSAWRWKPTVLWVWLVAWSTIGRLRDLVAIIPHQHANNWGLHKNSSLCSS